MKKKIVSLTLIISVILQLLLQGCSQAKSPVSLSGVYFDTVITVTLYEKNSTALINDCFKLADKYEKLFSKSLPESDVYKINSSYGEWIQVDPETFKLIDYSLKYEAISEGRFSVMCGALTELWNIGSDSGSSFIPPSPEEIEHAKSLCGSHAITLDQNSSSVMITSAGAKLDLGAVAKGYIADKMKEYLISQNVQHGIIQLGGNVLLIGTNPTKSDGHYNIGIIKPFGKTGDIITTISEIDKSIVTSGNYQRYTEYNGALYHHIIDLTTGYPASSSLNSVSVICNNSVDADIMSTILFLAGEDQGIVILDNLNASQDQIKAIFIDLDNEITYNSYSM